MGAAAPIDSTASKNGPGFMTIPAPPPYGASSTVRWRSCVKSRRSMMRYSTAPASRARDGMLSANGAVKNSGKIVMTLTRSGGRGVSASGTPGSSVIEQSSRRIDPNDTLGAVDMRDDSIVRYHDRIFLSLDVERESLRQL